MLSALIACCALVSPQEADSAPRGKAFGVVLDRDGEPWIGAEVHLFSLPLGSAPDVGGLDEVVVTSDENGRFRGLVLRGRAYTAWAVGDGGRRTDVAERVFAGDPTDLRELAPAAPLKLQVRGVDAWGDRAPLRWRVRTMTENARSFDGVLGEEAEIELPLLPGGQAQLVLLDREGRYLKSWHVSEGGETELELAPPCTVQARFRLGATEDPVVGGELWWVGFGPGQTTRLPVVELDERGRAEFKLPIGESWEHDNWSFRVTGEGCNSGIPAGGGDFGSDDEEIAKWRDAGHAVLACGLTPGRAVRGRLVWSGGEPAGGVPIVVRNRAGSQISRNSYYGAADPRIVSTAADGTFVVDGIRDADAVAIHVVLTDDVVARLPVGWRGRVRSVGLLGVVPSRARGAGAHDLGEIALDRDLWPLDLELRTPDGTPAAGARLVVQVAGVDSHAGPSQLTDRLGRVSRLVPRDVELLIGAMHPSGSCVDALTFTASRAVLEPQRLTLGLVVHRDVEVRCVDADREPVAGASVSLRPDWRGTIELDGALGVPSVLSDAVSVRAAQPDSQQLRLLLQSLLGSASVRTDADGVARIGVPPLDLGLRASAHAGSGDAWLRGDAEFELEEGQTRVTLELTTR